MSLYIDSLKKINLLDYETVFCAHEGIVKNGKQLMTEKLNYLIAVRDEVIRLHHLGLNDQEIRKKVLPKRVKLETFSFHSFSRLNLIRSCYQSE